MVIDDNSAGLDAGEPTTGDPSSDQGSVTDPAPRVLTPEPLGAGGAGPASRVRWSRVLLGMCAVVEVVVVVVGVLTAQPAVAALLVVVPMAASAVASVPLTGGFAAAAVAGAVGLGWVHGWSPVAPHALVTAGVVAGSAVAVVVAAVRARDEVALVAALRGRDRERRRRRAAEVRNRLHRLAAALAVSSSVADVADTTFDSLRSSMGPAAGLLGLVEQGADAEGRAARVCQSFGYRPGLTDRWPMVPLDPDIPSTAVVVAQRAIYAESADAFGRRWPRVAEDVARSGLEALCLLPLVVSSRSVGFLTVSWAQRRRFSDEERRFLQALADQCAQALERARLAEAERRARRRLAFLGDVTRLLTSLLDPTAVTDRLVDLVVGSMADACAVLVPAGSSLERRAGTGRGRTAVTVMDHLVGEDGVAVDSDSPIAEAWRTGRAVTVPVPLTVPVPVGGPALPVKPPTRDMVGAAGSQPTLLAVPLLAGGERLGVMVFLSGLEVATFSGDDRSMAGEVAARASTALYNATRFEHERNLAHLLQQALLPDALPAVPGVLLDAAYRAGTAGTEVGGDWFDAVALDDGRLLVSVGDVMGKGAAAAALMSQVRSAIRAYGMADPRPSVVLAQLDRLVDTVGDGRLVTALVGVVDPRAGRVHLASAGHLAPLVVGPGRLEIVDAAQRRILGARVPLAASPRLGVADGAWTGNGVGAAARDAAGEGDCAVELGSDDTLILYSDGLVERREEPITAGIARLGACASRCANGAGWPARAASLLVEALAIGDGVDDDVVVLTVGMDRSRTGGGSSPVWLPANGASLPENGAPFTLSDSASRADGDQVSCPQDGPSWAGSRQAPVLARGAPLSAGGGASPGDPAGADVSDRIVLAAEVASAPAARQWLGDLLHDYPADQRSRAQLLVGELVANAVLHADTEVSVGVRADGTLVHVEVADRSMVPPVAKPFAPDASTGRGLLLVRRLSTAWGVVGHEAGKVVWFEVGVEEPPSLVDPDATPPVVDLASWPSLDALALRDAGVVQEPEPTVAVLLLGAPVHLAVAAAAYYDELTREMKMALEARGAAAAGAAPHLDDVPAGSPTLEELVAAAAQIAPAGSSMTRALAMANDQWAEVLVAGSELVDMRIEIAEHAARQGVAVDRALDAVEQWCRSGGLLAMPAPEEVVAFRRWLLGEITGQYAGRAPIRWCPPETGP